MNDTYRNHIRSSVEIAEAIIHRVAGVAEPTTPPPHVGDPWDCVRPVRGLPRGRFRLPSPETDAHALALIAHGAHLRGWTIERFMLDAAVAAAQVERDRAAKRETRIVPGEGDITRRGDQNPDLRVTHGIHGVASLTAISDDDACDGR